MDTSGHKPDENGERHVHYHVALQLAERRRYLPLKNALLLHSHLLSDWSCTHDGPFLEVTTHTLDICNSRPCVMSRVLVSAVAYSWSDRVVSNCFGNLLELFFLARRMAQEKDFRISSCAIRLSPRRVS